VAAAAAYRSLRAPRCATEAATRPTTRPTTWSGAASKAAGRCSSTGSVRARAIRPRGGGRAARARTLPAELLQRPAALLHAPLQVVCGVVQLVVVLVAQDQRGARVRLGDERRRHKVADIQRAADCIDCSQAWDTRVTYQTSAMSRHVAARAAPRCRRPGSRSARWRPARSWRSAA